MKKKDLASRKQYIAIKESIFNRPVHVFLNYPYADYQKWLKKQHILDEEGKQNNNFAAFSTEFSSEERKYTEWVIFINDFQWTIHDMGSLIHEITHTIVKIWSSNNIPFNQDTQEFLAHSIGNLYEDISAKIHKVKKVKS